ncbi:MAG: EamA family transporter RarD [Planctomycetota bacterium]
MGEPAPRDSAVGLAYGVAAFGWWGVGFAAYLVLLNRQVDPGYVPTLAWAGEVLAHRVVWSIVVCLGLIAWLGRWSGLIEAVRNRKTRRTLAVTALLITANWVCFIYGAATGRLAEASLGYFINPVVSVFLGMLFLGERLRPLQWVSLAIACLGVAHEMAVVGVFPWIAITVALSFGMYGLLRKKCNAGPVVGLTVETAVILPLAVGFLLWQELSGDRLAFTRSGIALDGMLIGLGLATALPLLWFAAAVSRLKLGTIGFLQYLAPTGHFAIAVTMNGEPVTPQRLITFGLIWLGVAVFVIDAVRAKPRVTKTP